MKRILLIVVFSVVGLIGGAAAGMFLAPAPAPAEDETKAAHGDEKASGEEAGKAGDHADASSGDHGADHPAPTHGAVGPDPDRHVDYVKLERQFIVPVVEEGEISSLVVMSLAVEVDEGASDIVFEEEPKLRDAFLKVFFAHSQSGGFAGDFTRESRMADLRGRLYEAARQVLGAPAKGVLLTNVMRQDS